MISPASRTTGLVAILGLHALLLYGLANTLQLRSLGFVPPVLDVYQFEDQKPEAEPLPTVPVEGTLPAQEFEAPPVPEITATEVVEATPLQPAPTPALPMRPEPPAHSATPLLPRAIRSPDEYYPPQSVQLGEQGAAVVLTCVGGDGLLQREPSIATSSGSALLDAAAVKWAREALRFTPATRNGQPIAACKGFRVVFKLTNRPG